MCTVCWADAGTPTLDTRRVRETADALRKLYRVHPTGGTLHVVVVDYNVDDALLEWEPYQEPDDEIEKTVRTLL